jgi:hypothetical protein
MGTDLLIANGFVKNGRGDPLDEPVPFADDITKLWKYEWYA